MGVLSLLFLVPLYPHVSGLFLALNNVVQILNLFIQLFFAHLEVSLQALSLRLQGLVVSCFVRKLLLQFLVLSLLPRQLLCLEFKLVLTLLFGLHLLS